MIRHALRLAPLLVLAACATPEHRCVLDVTKEYRTLTTLIAESEGNLARGYTIDREVERRPRLTFCTGGFRRHVGVNFCTTEDIVYRDRPVAIDPDAERRKLQVLNERKARLDPVVRDAVAACRGTP